MNLSLKRPFVPVYIFVCIYYYYYRPKNFSFGDIRNIFQSLTPPNRGKLINLLNFQHKEGRMERVVLMGPKIDYYFLLIYCFEVRRVQVSYSNPNS